MDIRKLKQLIQMLEETDVTEIEIHEGEESVRISRLNHGVMTQPMLMPQFQTHHQAAPAATSAENHTKAAAPAISGHQVTAPMVGTLYFSPSPESPPFVTVGQRVEVGTTICIIEAMKMFNEIESDKAGVIKQILVENGTPVEYGQPLFVIE